jgi:hypothetical protein
MKVRRREAKEAQIPSRRLQRCRLQRLEDPIERAHSLLQEAKRPARPLGEARGTCQCSQRVPAVLQRGRAGSAIECWLRGQCP